MEPTRNMKQKHLAEFKTLAFGRVKPVILDSSNNVVKEFPWKNNIILNSGLDMVCTTYTWAQAFAYAVVGTGITPTIDDLTATATATQSGGTLTIVSGYDLTSITNQYNMIKFSTGEEFMITSVASATSATVTPTSPNISSATGFKIYRVNQTGLTTEVQRSNTYLTGAGNCETTATAATGTAILRRTVDFAAESGSITYNECGFSPVASAGANLLNRILLSPGVSLVAGQKLRLIYDLTLVQSPITSQAITASITGWPISPSTNTEGDQQCECWGISSVGTSGASGSISMSPTFGTAIMYAEPSQSTRVFASTTSTALQTFTLVPLRMAGDRLDVSNDCSLSTYSSRDFFRLKYTTLTESQSVSSSLRSIGLGANGDGNNVFAGFRLLFDQNQSKTSLATLQLNFRVTIGRVLGSA